MDEGDGERAPAGEHGLLSGLASREAVLDALLPAHDAVYVKDREGRYLMVNATGAANLGYAPGELVGRTDIEVFAGQLGERCGAQINRSWRRVRRAESRSR